MSLLCVNVSLNRLSGGILTRVIGHNWWSVIENARQNERHAVWAVIKSSLNPLELMSKRICNQPDDVKTTGKSLILTVRKQKMRSGKF